MLHTFANFIWCTTVRMTAYRKSNTDLSVRDDLEFRLYYISLTYLSCLDAVNLAAASTLNMNFRRIKAVAISFDAISRV